MPDSRVLAAIVAGRPRQLRDAGRLLPRGPARFPPLGPAGAAPAPGAGQPVRRVRRGRHPRGAAGRASSACLGACRHDGGHRPGRGRRWVAGFCGRGPRVPPCSDRSAHRPRAPPGRPGPLCPAWEAVGYAPGTAPRSRSAGDHACPSDSRSSSVFSPSSSLPDGAAQPPKRSRSPWTSRSAGYHAPWFVAQDKGYFAEQGPSTSTWGAGYGSGDTGQEARDRGHRHRAQPSGAAHHRQRGGREPPDGDGLPQPGDVRDVLLRRGRQRAGAQGPRGPDLRRPPGRHLHHDAPVRWPRRPGSTTARSRSSRWTAPSASRCSPRAASRCSAPSSTRTS